MSGIEIEESADQKAINLFIEKFKSKSDDIFEKYKTKDHPPILVTDEEEIAHIALGLGLAHLEPIETGIKIVTEPIQIYWDGKQFQIYSKDEKIKTL